MPLAVGSMAEEGKSRAPAQRVAERYEVLGRLGSGPHGPTYRALDHRRLERDPAQRVVALKILRARAAEAPDFDERLRALQDGLAALEDEVVVAPRDCGRTELGLAYLSHELVRGHSLEERLQTEGALGRDAARALVLRLARALSGVHARGFVHGALGPQHVLLPGEPRGVAPPPAEAGVGNGHAPAPLAAEEREESAPADAAPRLLDVGLAGLLAAPERAPAPRDDVRALGRLLAAALSGDPSGATLPADLDPETARVVERALDPGGLATMEELVRALAPPEPEPEPAPDASAPREARSEVLVRPGPSRAPLVAAALVLATAAGLGAWYARGALAAERARERAALEREVAERSRRERALQDELAAARSALEARVDPAALEAEQERLGQRVDQLGAELSAAQEEARTLRAEKDAVARTKEEDQRALDAERDRLAALQEEHDRTLAALQRMEARREEERRASALLADALRERIAAGDPRGVWSLCESLAAQGRLPASLAPQPLLDAWTEAGDLLRRTEGADVAQAGALVVQARAAIARARQAQGVFTLALRETLGSQPALEEALEGALRDLENQAEERLAVREAALHWEWNALLAAPLEADPRQGLALAAAFPAPADRTGELARALAQALGARCEPGGALDQAALRGVPDLAGWLEPLRAAAPRAEEAVRALERFAWAQAWPDPGRFARCLASWPRPERAGADDPAARAGTWQAALVCEALLLHEDGPYPGPPGRRALYRTRGADGTLGWQVETLGGEEGTRAAWTVSQSFYDADGRFQGRRELGVARAGRTIVEEGVRPRVLFRAASGPRPSEAWSAPADDPPFRLPIGPDAVAAFRERTASAPLVVLVCEEDGATSWWSAELGLVRHADAGVTRELYFSD